jgi:hypothetical protein
VLLVGDPRHEDRVFDKEVPAWIPADTTVRVQRILQIRGRVLGDDGAPLPGASVRTDDRKHHAHVDAEGNFRFTGLLPGRYRLVAQHGEMPPGEVAEAATEDEGVVLRAPRGLAFEVRIADWEPRWSETNGGVVDGAGKPLAGGGGREPDANGVVRLNGYPPGSRLSFRLRTRGGTHVAVARDVLVGAPATVRLEPGAPIRGRLIGPDGTVPANAGVAATDGDGRVFHVERKEDGTFVIEGPRRGERVDVTGWGGPLGADRRASWVARLTDVEAGATLDLELRPR